MVHQCCSLNLLDYLQYTMHMFVPASKYSHKAESGEPFSCFGIKLFFFVAAMNDIVHDLEGIHDLRFFFIQFNFPFKIISLISRRANRKVGRNGSTPGKPPDTPASRIWLVSHVASAGLEPTPDTAVRWSNV